jgi:hypothetical protein
VGSKLLIAGGEAAPSSQALPPGVKDLIDGADEILVIAPTLPSRLDWLTSATDKAREQADERLGAVLGQLNEMGADAEGSVASDDPIEAFGDAMRDFSADHILVAMRSGDRAGWQERGLLDELVERFSVPITVFQL